MNTSIFTNNTLLSTIRDLLILAGWILLSTNPIGTLVATEVLLIQEHTTFLYQLPVDNGGHLLVVSPWIFYLIIHLLLSICFLIMSIKITQRPAK